MRLPFPERLLLLLWLLGRPTLVSAVKNRRRGEVQRRKVKEDDNTLIKHRMRSPRKPFNVQVIDLETDSLNKKKRKPKVPKEPSAEAVIDMTSDNSTLTGRDPYRLNASEIPYPENDDPQLSQPAVNTLDWSSQPNGTNQVLSLPDEHGNTTAVSNATSETETTYMIQYNPDANTTGASSLNEGNITIYIIKDNATTSTVDQQTPNAEHATTGSAQADGEQRHATYEVELEPFQILYTPSMTDENEEMHLLRVTRFHLSTSLALAHEEQYDSLELFQLFRNDATGHVDSNDYSMVAFGGSAFYHEGVGARRVHLATQLAFLGDNLTQYFNVLQQDGIPFESAKLYTLDGNPILYENGMVVIATDSPRASEQSMNSMMSITFYILAVGVPCLICCLICLGYCCIKMEYISFFRPKGVDPQGKAWYADDHRDGFIHVREVVDDEDEYDEDL